ncbi:hypothetical protein EAE91_10105 [Photorhabdus noenieputensis]|uniref:hypothetical protein n=1 Tax=Photorhabdus noenieputensis TaxID=1208607 RepID=UPI001BD1C5D7|nr:hypothetical protein [Photorhabdus noenieputensis]MBS9437513.1 hypothetical protein [Photorhabdus noenieputensis]MCK3668285.1 hypothetical protein [Photorhabdus noenieputensis]
MSISAIKNNLTKQYSTLIIFPVEVIVNLLSSFFLFFILIYIITLPLTSGLDTSSVGFIIFLIVILRPILSVINNLSLFFITKKQAYILSTFSSCFTNKKDAQQNEHDIVNYSTYDVSVVLMISKVICFIYLSVLMVINVEGGTVGLLSLCSILIPLSFFLFKKRAYLSKQLAKIRKWRYKFIGDNFEALTTILLTRYQGGKLLSFNRIINIEEKVKRIDSLWRAVDISSNAFLKIIPVLFLILIGKEIYNSDKLLILLYSLILVSEYLGLVRLLTPFYDGYLAKLSIIRRCKNYRYKPEEYYDLDGEQGFIEKTILGNIYLSKDLINRSILNKLSYEIFQIDKYIDMSSNISDLSRGQLNLIFAVRNVYMAIIDNYRGHIYFDVNRAGWDSNLLFDLESIISKIKAEYEIDIILSFSHKFNNIELETKNKPIKSTSDNGVILGESYKINKSKISQFLYVFSYNSVIGTLLLFIASLSLFELGRVTYNEYDSEIYKIISISLLGMISLIVGSYLIELKIRKRARQDVYSSIKSNFRVEGFNLFKHEYNVIINKFTMYAKDIFWFGSIFVGTVLLFLNSENFMIVFGTMLIFLTSIYLLYPLYKDNRNKHYKELHALSIHFSYIKKLPQCGPANRFCRDTILFGIRSLYTVASKRYLINSLASILGLIISSLIIFYSLYPSFESDNITAAINLDNRIVIFYFAIFGYLSEIVSIKRITEHNNIYYKERDLFSKLSILEQSLEKDRVIQLVGNNGSGKTFFLKKLSEIKGYIYIDHNFDPYLANDRFLDYLNKSDSEVIIFDEFDCRKLINRIDKNKKIIVVSHMETIGSILNISEVV